MAAHRDRHTAQRASQRVADHGQIDRWGVGLDDDFHGFRSLTARELALQAQPAGRRVPKSTDLRVSGTDFLHGAEHVEDAWLPHRGSRQFRCTGPENGARRTLPVVSFDSMILANHSLDATQGLAASQSPAAMTTSAIPSATASCSPRRIAESNRPKAGVRKK